MTKNYDILTNIERKKVKIVLKALLVGVSTAFVVILYRYALQYAEKISFSIYSFITTNKWAIPIWFLILAFMGYLVGKIVNKEPYASGSGIPQIKGIMNGYIKNRPITTIIYKFLGGVTSIIGGLSLGREGPSVQLGACTADLISDKLNTTPLDKKLLMSSGASAGLAAAFNAPLSGVMFSLEEIYKYFSPLVLLATMTAAISADYISKQFFGFDPVFNFGETSFIPLSNYWIIIVLGIVLGAAGAFYNWFTIKVQGIYSKINLKNEYKMMIPFLIAGIMGLIFPVVLCGGHSVIHELNLSNTLLMLVLIVVMKFLFSLVSFGSGAPGGIFFPLLIIGGGLGAVFGYFAINYLGVAPEFFNNFIILAMAGYFTAIVRAPITGVILITEMTGSFTHLLSLTCVSVIAYIVADLLKSAPIYDSLLESLLKKLKIKVVENQVSKKVLVPIVVQYGCKIEGKKVKDITLPKEMLIVSIRRGEKEILPNGNTLIKGGDILLIMTSENLEYKLREDLEVLTVV